MLIEWQWGAIALFSVVWVELVRDSYHLLSHFWKPLYRLHNIHHRVFRPDLTVIDPALYRRSQWQNDVPEHSVMLAASLLPFFLTSHWIGLTGTVYTFFFLISAIGRGLGWSYVDELTDITHRPGAFTKLPGRWFVNRPYHWRHHFDDQRAYYCSTFTILDKLLGNSISLKGKRVAVTGASGTLGKGLLEALRDRGAKVTALTSKSESVVLKDHSEVNTITWKLGHEEEIISELEKIDILILNHGVNVYGERTPSAIECSYEVNAFSSWRLLESFLTTIRTNEDKACKEVWVNTSEAEVSPALSPLYELSKRTLGDLVTLRRLDSPCVIRKIILGPFKSKLNPFGVMSGSWVAKQIVNLAVRDFRNIVVTINPFTYLIFPLKEFFVSLYFRLFSSKT
ncbi:bifunctional sterol desaturase/short chain dehydrogenase [Euhalothece natronophila Z-M001]|uniref:Bifunctional sterol desaturase/short chain dehydrogenase n=1 Tax=Euhalothece natronophila Z-M001 TaxID=522448 RepID=A0A5B8NP28_9CHRO|nr:bifunctional sterol desaturase/short chain dehydrogenase [Euhalothece natronophila]QDZ41012.1 bifunctional sterol desaturase/short chain dehydrogenase [Euhalothece natronophila Z-M001]